MSSREVLYRIALLDNKECTIDIDKVYENHIEDPQYRSKHDFFCPCCDSKMEAVLEVKEGHAKFFRHSDTHCDRDSLLHSTAEEVFYSEYKRCLQEGIPFILDVYSEVRCDERCINKACSCSNKYHKQVITLTDKYKVISPEKRVLVEGKFRRPDLLLESENGEQLWVEIWVTHRAEKEKLKQGNILELQINSEDDIKNIYKHRLTQRGPSDEKVKVYLNQVCSTPELPNKTIDILQNTYNIIIGDNINDLTDLKELPISHIKPYYKETIPSWVNLGLPSGTLWSNDYMGNMSFSEALERYGNLIPSPEQFLELVTSSQAIAPHPAGFIGPNGNLLEIYEGDFWTSQSCEGNQAIAFHREFLSKFISTSGVSPIKGNCFAKANKDQNLCVRLVKQKE